MPSVRPDEVEEEYDGPARLTVADRDLDVHATLSGRFDPITGRYQWSGRLRPDGTLDTVLEPNAGTVELTIDEGHRAAMSVRERDPWGGFRVAGTGRPPFAVPTESP